MDDSPLDDSRTFSSLEEVMGRLASARGRSFRELDRTGRTGVGGNKGSLGQVIEESVLGYPINADPNPDIQVGDERYELKVTPLKHVRKGKETSAKERLVIDIIDFMRVAKERDFEASYFWDKARNILIVYYYDDRADKKKELRIDCRVLDSMILEYTKEDLATIRDDWRLIRDKIASGHADALSEADTNYLAASTKGAGNANKDEKDDGKLNDIRKAPAPQGSPEPFITAKQRAFSYKASYMTMVARRFLSGEGRGDSATKMPMSPDQDLNSYVNARFHDFIGKTAGEINDLLHADISPRIKQYNAYIALALLGITKDVRTGKRKKIEDIEQFRAANVTQIKSVTIYPGGLPKENMSFPALVQEQWDEWADPNVQWEDSCIYRFFEENRFLIVASESPIPYASGHDKSGDILLGGFLWNMPESDIDRYVKPVWERVHNLLVAKRWLNYGVRGKNLLPGQDFNKVFHLRPHSSKGRNSGNPSDRIVLPSGEIITKQSFWLDRRYIADLIQERGLWRPKTR